MAKKRSCWLMGCAIVGGLLLIMGVAALVGGTVWVQGMMSGFDKAIEARQRLEEAQGKAADFVPWADGAIPAHRIETFLAARAAMAPARAQLADLFRRLPGDPDELDRMDKAPLGEKLGMALNMSRAAFGLGSVSGEFFSARNQALLDAGMGLGEYAYIYVLVYDSWLRVSPARSLFQSPGTTTIRVTDDDGIEKVRRSSLSKRLRDELREMMRHQLSAARALPPDQLPEGWLAALEAEVAALESDPLRQPWADGPPAAVVTSLQPLRAELEASFDAASDSFELLQNKRRGRFSIQAE